MIFFYINHFSLIIFYHSFWLGFGLFGSYFRYTDIEYSFTLVCKGYDNHNCHNKPQMGNVTGVWMTSCPEAMVLRIWRFSKIVSWELPLDYVGRQLGYRPQWQTVEVGVRLRCWEVGSDHKVEQLGPTMMLRNWGPSLVWRNWKLLDICRAFRCC